MSRLQWLSTHLFLFTFFTFLLFTFRFSHFHFFFFLLFLLFTFLLSFFLKNVLSFFTFLHFLSFLTLLLVIFYFLLFTFFFTFYSYLFSSICDVLGATTLRILPPAHLLEIRLLQAHSCRCQRHTDAHYGSSRKYLSSACATSRVPLLKLSVTTGSSYMLRSRGQLDP